MPKHPHPSIWDRLTAHVAADPTPGEQRLAGAVQHAQAEPVASECFIAEECVNDPRCMSRCNTETP